MPTTNVLSVKELIDCNNPMKASISDIDNDETNVAALAFQQIVSFVKEIFLCNEMTEKTLQQLNDNQNAFEYI